MAGSPKGKVEGEVAKIGRVKVDRCIGMYPPKAGAKAQRAKLRGDRCLKDSRNLRRKKEDLKGHTRSAKAMVGR